MDSRPYLPTPRPQRIAPETWLIPNFAPAGDGLYLPVNSMLIRGRQPVIVDTGAPLHRARWLEQVFSTVEPEDVRWIFLSHDDGDHTGGLLDVLDRCRNATLVTSFFSVERLALEKPALPLQRMRWIEPGGSFDAGDRVLQLFRPPIFDGPTTRGLFDPTSGAMWIVDTFACLTPGALDAADLAPEQLEQMSAMNSAVSPWHAWLDRRSYPPLRLVRFSGAALTEGVEEHVVDGVTVRVTGVAKTVADCFKYRNKIGVDVALEALREAWNAKRMTSDEISHYAKIDRVANVMRPYLESLA